MRRSSSVAFWHFPHIPDEHVIPHRMKTGKDLTGMVIADIVLQLLSYVAQTEREFDRQRQAEGISAAKSRGVQFGRRRIRCPEKYPEVKKSMLSFSLMSIVIPSYLW